MKIYTRELLMNRSLELSQIIRTFSEDSNYAPVQSKLLEIQDEFGRLRSPLHTMITSAISRIDSIQGGAVTNPDAKSSAIRKQKLSMSIDILVEVNEVVRSEIEAIDLEFDAYKEKLAQAIAALSVVGKMPIFESTHKSWTRKIWANMVEDQTTKGMAVYLKAKLSTSDRESIMDELLRQMVSE